MENVHPGVREAVEEAEAAHTADAGGGQGARRERGKERKRVMKDIVKIVAHELRATVEANSPRGITPPRRNLRVHQLPTRPHLHHRHLLVKGSPRCKCHIQQPILLTFFYHQLKPAGDNIQGLF